MKEEYDIYIEYEKIYLKGNLDEQTDFDIYIKETDRLVTAKIPNNIKPYSIIKLRGLGKKKNDWKFGNLYISFKNVFSENENVKKIKKFEYKYVKEIYLVDETIKDYAEDGWRCVSVQPIITSLNSSSAFEGTISYTPDYEYNILFEREIIS